MENSQKNETPQPKRLGQKRRLEFIDFRLQWEGKINRRDLVEFFGISLPQISLDIAEYTRLAPGNIEYDRNEKVYFASSEFKPVLVSPSTRQYLRELRMILNGTLEKDNSVLGEVPSGDLVKRPHRDVSSTILKPVLKAINQRLTLSIEYQSLNKDQPTLRDISPHALAFDGYRWHARAYCHTRNQFRDFVLGRILGIHANAPSLINPNEDGEWENILQIKLTPHPDLSPHHRRVVELDYGMEGGLSTIVTRQALLFYTLRQFRILRGIGSNHTPQLALANEAELTPYLDLIDLQFPSGVS